MPMVRITMLAAIFSVAPLAVIAGEQPKAGAIVVTEAEGVVELLSVDRTARTALVRTPSGTLVEIRVPPEAHNLDRVKKGDLFRMRYVEAVALALHKGGEASAAQQQTVQVAPRGGTPGGSVVNIKQMTTVVAAVDRGKRTISVRGPQNQVIALKVADEVRSFDEIAVGDSIAVTYTEALALEMMSNAANR
jgi:hypothetical protein